MTDKKTKYTKLAVDWKTGHKLRLSLGGNSSSWNEKIIKLRDALIGDIVESGAMTADEAEGFVDERFAGMRQGKRGAAAPAASGEAKTMLLEKYSPKRNDKKSPNIQR